MPSMVIAEGMLHHYRRGTVEHFTLSGVANGKVSHRFQLNTQNVWRGGLT